MLLLSLLLLLLLLNIPCLFSLWLRVRYIWCVYKVLKSIYWRMWRFRCHIAPTSEIVSRKLNIHTNTTGIPVLLPLRWFHRKWNIGISSRNNFYRLFHYYYSRFWSTYPHQMLTWIVHPQTKFIPSILTQSESIISFLHILLFIFLKKKKQ